jgi:preprotein translocase subunit SecB
VPQIFIGATHVGGCDDLMALVARGGLDAAAGGLTDPLGAFAAPPEIMTGDRAAGRAASPAAPRWLHFFFPIQRDIPWPTRNIQRMYLKDLSLEQPNSPQILLEQAQPQVDINLGMAAAPVADGIFEVTVTATVTAKINDKVLFLVEAKQAGIFEIRNVPQEQMQGIISIVCPQMIYPYLRAIVSDVCTRAGFPPILLTEVNFQAMFEAQQAQAAAQGNGGSRIITSPN